MKKLLIVIFLFCVAYNSFATYILIPMNDGQKNHLKAYGIAFWTLQNDVEVKWLLNYDGGSFLIEFREELENECIIRNVTYRVIADVKVSSILSEISQNDVNMDGEVQYASGPNSDQVTILNVVGSTTPGNIYSAHLPE
jgi:hypothetical protein